MKIVSRATLLPIDNIDTDRIIPARFLTTTERTGMGEHLFEDWPEGAAVLDDAKVLVAGNNFGCGSSREHAVWSLADRGFGAVIATGFADIFHANAIRNGLAPVIVKADDHVRLIAEIEADPARPVILDFSVDRLTCGSINASFSAIAPSAHDTPGGTELDALLHQIDRIITWEADRRPRIDTREGDR